MSLAEEFVEFLAYVRRLSLSFLAVYALTLIVLAVYREPLYVIYALAKKGLGTTVIAGGAVAPLTAYMYISLLYAVVAWIPLASMLTYQYLKVDLNESELKWLRVYTISIPLVFIASLILAIHLFYPAFIRISIVFANLVGAEPVYTVDSITMLFVASLLLTAVTLIEPLVLSTIMHVSKTMRKKIAGSTIRDRALVYAGMYWVYAILTPGDAVFSTLVYTGILVMGTEIVIAYWKRSKQ